MSGKKKKKKRSSGTKSSFNKLRTKILSLLDENISKAYSVKQITKKLKVRDAGSKHLVTAILFDLRDDDQIHQLRNGSFKSKREPEFATGVVDFVNHRFGYIVSEELHEDIWVKAENMNFALHGDQVRVMIFPQHRKGRRPEGRVVEVITRGRSEYVGRIEMNPGYAFVIPDNRKMYQDIFLKIEDLKNAKDNDKVIVKIIQWPSYDKNPRGVVLDVLGPAGEHEAEIHSIVAEFGLPLRFPKQVLESAQKINNSISKAEIARRKDFRQVTTFTIDPEDAKDFDDALSIKNLPNGHYEVGIHIADVTHFLKENTAWTRKHIKEPHRFIW